MMIIQNYSAQLRVEFESVKNEGGRWWWRYFWLGGLGGTRKAWEEPWPCLLANCSGGIMSCSEMCSRMCSKISVEILKS